MERHTLKMAARTHVGLVRLNNEDFVFSDATQGIAVLADGMGGLFAGEDASAVAVEAVRRQLLDENFAVTSTAQIEQLVRHAHEVLLEYAETQNYVGKMGTTLVVWVALGGCSYFAHVGDSRLYHHDGDELHLVSKDHTVAQRLLDMGALTPRQAQMSPKRHVLTQGLGLPGVIHPQTGSLNLNGRFLLCSDGLSDLVPTARIAELMAAADIEAAATELVRLALDEGGQDNISLILIEA
ncbi:MAG: protein phosphatase 2C domain-containing protein [Pseudomonadota bacterium]